MFLPYKTIVLLQISVKNHSCFLNIRYVAKSVSNVYADVSLRNSAVLRMSNSKRYIHTKKWREKDRRRKGERERAKKRERKVQKYQKISRCYLGIFFVYFFYLEQANFLFAQ